MLTLDYQNPRDARRETGGGFLRALFGPSKAEQWRRLADAVGGAYLPGGFWRSDRVQARVGPWTLTLDTFAQGNGESSSTYTRLRAPYRSRDGFRFRAHHAGVFTPIGKWLGMQDIDVGDPVFDAAFVLKGRDEAKVRAVFADPKIRQLMLAKPRLRLEAQGDPAWFFKTLPPGVDQLYFQDCGVIKDVERLAVLFDLFAAVLHQLSRIGVAERADPGVEL